METRQSYIADLKRQFGETPRNPAIAHHLTKLEAMTDAEWPAHRAHLDELGSKARPAAKRMAAEVFRK